MATKSGIMAQNHADIIVDQKDQGDYQTISEAIAALSMYPYQRTIIFIKNGVYEEKLRIEQNYITLRGESRDSTIIRYNQPREAWNKNKDWIGPGVINLEGDDIVLDNLTIENSQPEIGPHAFAVYGLNPTRTVIINCNVLSKGGDTVSLWNYKNGMYYHANCFFQGAVDFVCPRGWCYVRDSKFYEVKKGTAALWHAGNYDSDQKFVLYNCSFDGVKDFDLGRHHYEAQFYLLDCSFSENMADKPLYKVYDKNPDRNNPYYGGNRIYYYNCHKDGKQYDWYRNNLQPEAPKPKQITASWTFNNKWDPESQNPLKVTGFETENDTLILSFDNIVTVRGEPQFTTALGKVFKLVMQRFNDINKLSFVCSNSLSPDDLKDAMTLSQGSILSSIASVHERLLPKHFHILQTH